MSESQAWAYVALGSNQGDPCRQVLAAIPPEKLSWTLFRHPVSGNLDARRGVAFLTAHIDHHRAQVGRIRSSPGFPS